MKRIPDNEFLEQFLDDMPSADKAYHNLLVKYKKAECNICGNGIWILKKEFEVKKPIRKRCNSCGKLILIK